MSNNDWEVKARKAGWKSPEYVSQLLQTIDNLKRPKKHPKAKQKQIQEYATMPGPVMRSDFMRAVQHFRDDLTN